MKTIGQKIILSILILIFNQAKLFSQSNDSLTLRKIYSEILKNGKAYEWLHDLSTTIGTRLSGSLQAAQSVEWTKKKIGAENQPA